MTYAYACRFCRRNWDALDLVEVYVGGRVAVVNPLNPVTDGHVLVIHGSHTTDAAADPYIAGLLMRVAAEYVQDHGLQANIITSIGADATQTVRHTHVHVVPRRPGDALPLPWTPQPR